MQGWLGICVVLQAPETGGSEMGTPESSANTAGTTDHTASAMAQAGIAPAADHSSASAKPLGKRKSTADAAAETGAESTSTAASSGRKAAKVCSSSVAFCIMLSSSTTHKMTQ